MNQIQKMTADPADAKLMAQIIAHGPVVFQVARCLKSFGILDAINRAQNGLTVADMLNQIRLSDYSLNVLLDGGESSGLVVEEDGFYKLTLVGRMILKDPLTEVNMEFTQDVCYQGMFDLERSLRENQPWGLKVFGDWPTIYHGLTQLPPNVLRSWLAYDHYYSDGAFPLVLPILFKDRPKKILDVGGNTGKFSVECAKYNPDVQVKIVDLPKQLELAAERAERHGFSDRISGHSINILDHSQPLPEGHDAIWMSQFLDCFSKEDIVRILERARTALAEDGHIYVMEGFTDQQRHPIARFCLDMLSMYFTALANGTSRMYRARDFRELISASGLEIVEEHHQIGLTHSLLKCRRKT